MFVSVKVFSVKNFFVRFQGILNLIINFYKKQLIVTALLYIIKSSNLFKISENQDCFIKKFSALSSIYVCVATVK